MYEHTLTTRWSSLEEPCKTTQFTKGGYQEATQNGMVQAILALNPDCASDTHVKPATQCEGATAFPQHGTVLP